TSTFASTEVWKMGGHFFEFSRNDSTGLLISKSCEQKKCEASKILKTISLKKLTAEKFSGGKNPGAVLCHELKNAQVVFLRDLKGNDNSFCMLSDKSFVSSGSLEIEARKNDEK
ncbi:MAG: hypothetical protein H7281_10865, partial [Bacteriovorax sp.]|nr:hypothetical protein [Bacteriovorax sp.]